MGKHTRRKLELDWGLHYQKATLRRVSLTPLWVSRVDGTACEVQADTQAHHASLWRPDAQLTNHSQDLQWAWSGCLRGRRNGLLSREGILAVYGGEDVNR